MPPFGQSLLALDDIKGLGRQGLRALVKVFGDDLGKVWRADPNRLQKLLEEARVPSSEGIAEDIAKKQGPYLAAGHSEAARLANKRVSILQPSEIPEQLKAIPHPPLWLFVEGNVDALYHRPAVAVVGTRQASFVGREAAALVSEMLASYPITLVSGLAEGIDEEAHRSSLREGVTNVAFLGTGIDEEFPASTAGLRFRIIREGGAVVTEYLPKKRRDKKRYNKANFVERNRLQAGLADMVVPVEANPKGGTAHTVRFAREFGRRVVGVRWKGANGILSELEQNGHPIVDVFEPSGRRCLDGLFRALAENEGHETSALASVTRRLRREAKYRDLRRADLEELRRELEVFADEIPSDGHA
jgi:DNA protecting protein DprA